MFTIAGREDFFRFLVHSIKKKRKLTKGIIEIVFLFCSVEFSLEEKNVKDIQYRALEK